MTCVEKPYPCEVPEYALTGPQVEPEASFWNHCPQLRLVSIKELTTITDDPGHIGYFPPYPDWCTAAGQEEIKKEFEELLELSKLRDDPCSLVSDTGGCPNLTEWPCEPRYELPKAFGCRAPISRLFNLMPPALGAVQVNRLPGQQVIRTGRGLARALENETPGIFHRHALNYLITTRSWSPPRQALVWAALDIAIASALQAAWYYKWLSPRQFTSRRPRPVEYGSLDVLFDRPDELNPMYITCPDARPCNPVGFSPGTPRHPAYPSGHSTYAGAASTILAYFFGNDPTPNALTLGLASTTIGQELRNMADNIGMARMWAGIHWRSDHEAGLKLGQVVACLVLRQLSSICGCRFDLCPPMMPMPPQCDCTGHEVPCPDDKPPPCDELKQQAWACMEHCPPCGESWDCLPAPCPGPMTGGDVADAVEPEQLDQRSVQQGALSAAQRAEIRQRLEGSAPQDADSGAAATGATAQGTTGQPAAGPEATAQDAGAQGATPESLDRRSVQQGGE